MPDFGLYELGTLERWEMLYGGFSPETAKEGKYVLDKDLELTYLGLSANSLEPGQDAGYWHKHSHIEEAYVFLTGEGQMALDDQVISVNSGTVIRVGQGVWRTWGCSVESEGPLKWLCIRGGGCVLPDLPDDAEIDRERPSPW